MYGVGDHYSLHYDGYYELRGNRDYDTDGYRAGVWVGNRWVLLHSVQGHHYHRVSGSPPWCSTVLYCTVLYRIASLVLYLSSPPLGGYTVFP